METPLFTVRYPANEQEALDQEKLMAEARIDNPLLKVHRVSHEAIYGLFSSSRDWELKNRQRVSIYDKSSGSSALRSSSLCRMKITKGLNAMQSSTILFSLGCSPASWRWRARSGASSRMSSKICSRSLSCMRSASILSNAEEAWPL